MSVQVPLSGESCHWYDKVPGATEVGSSGPDAVGELTKVGGVLP